MSELTEDEIETLKQIHPKRKILRLAFLISGSVFIFIGILFLLIGFDFELVILEINFSFVVDILIILFGMILFSKYFIASYHIRENSIVFTKMRNLREPITSDIRFNSFTISRLIPAFLLTIAGAVSLIVFGTDFGHEVPYGSAVFLGGPSWFYLTGLPALGFGLGLFLYILLSPFRGIFSKSKNFFFFYEIRPGFPWLTEIPRKDVEMIRYQNNYLGPKLLWFPAFFPFIVMQLQTSISLFSAERAAPEFVLSWTFLFISIMEIISLIILVFFQQNFFEIATESRLYEMWFAPIKIKKQSQFKDKFSDYLGCGLDYREGEDLISEDSPFKDVDNFHFQLFNLIFGLLMIILAFVMLVNMVIFGQLVWWLALIYGFILIARSFSYDFSDKKGDKFVYDENAKQFTFQRRFRYKFQHYTSHNLEQISLRKWFRRLDAFDIIFISGLTIFLIVQQGFGWALVGDSTVLILDNVISTLILIIILLSFFLYVCFPIDVIELKTHSITYRIPITIKLADKTIIQKYIQNFKKFFAQIKGKDMRKTFLLRAVALFFIIVGSLLYILIYFVVLF